MNVETSLKSSTTQKTGRAVAVLGLGLIGSSWAQTFLKAGLIVRAWDPRKEACEALRSSVRADEHSLLIFDTAQEAVHSTFFVQESGPEDLAVKRGLLAVLNSALSPDAL